MITKKNIKTAKDSITRWWVLDIFETRTGDVWNADCVTDTSMSTVAYSAHLLRGGLKKKTKQDTVSLWVKTFFSQNAAADPKSPLPLLSLFPESNQSSFSGPCASCCLVMFFPVLIFSPLWTCAVEQWSGDGHFSPPSFLWLERRHLL